MIQNETQHLTTIRISVENREWLKSIGKKGDTYVDIINTLREKVKKGDEKHE